MSAFPHRICGDSGGFTIALSQVHRSQVAFLFSGPGGASSSQGSEKGHFHRLHKGHVNYCIALTQTNGLTMLIFGDSLLVAMLGLFLLKGWPHFPAAPVAEVIPAELIRPIVNGA